MFFYKFSKLLISGLESQMPMAMGIRRKCINKQMVMNSIRFSGFILISCLHSSNGTLHRHKVVQNSIQSYQFGAN